MSQRQTATEREVEIAKVLRPLGDRPLSKQQAELAGRLLGLHWTSVYRLRRRFLADPVASAVAARQPGPGAGSRRVLTQVDQVIDKVMAQWLGRKRQLAHPLLDLTLEIRRRCRQRGLPEPSRSTVRRRLGDYRDAQAQALARSPDAQIPPGHLSADAPLQIVQIDHTQADVFLVDEHFRKSMGRPWLSLAIDVATRCIVGVYVAMERPSAAVVAMLLTRVVMPKAPWIASLGLDVAWPMNGIPQTLHLDNAAEFKSRALRSGCSQYGMDLTYRPVGRPQFGGHIERLNRTFMERLRGLPGATGNSPKGRKARKSEQSASLTLAEFERWLVLEIAQRYHHADHEGLMGATPASAWKALGEVAPPRQLPMDVDAALKFVVRFLPMARRTVQSDGLRLFYIRYWHPVFATWRERKKQVIVRYHPEDLSRIFASLDGRNYVEARYADLRRPRISLWEQRLARQILKAQGDTNVSEALIFKTIEQQRQIVAKSNSATQAKRRGVGATGRAVPPAASDSAGEAKEDVKVDYSTPAAPYDAEIW